MITNRDKKPWQILRKKLSCRKNRKLRKENYKDKDSMKKKKNKKWKI